MKLQTTVYVLIAVCSVLAIGTIFLGWMVFTKIYTPPPQQQPTVIHVQAAQVESSPPPSTTRRELPTYPQRNPAYPLRGQASDFQQLGTLTNSEIQPPTILPLFGKPLATHKDRWEYYTTTSGEHMLRVQLMFEDKDCTDSDIGCREVYNGDNVFVPSYQKQFKVQLYKYRDFSYSPN